MARPTGVVLGGGRNGEESLHPGPGRCHLARFLPAIGTRTGWPKTSRRSVTPFLQSVFQIGPGLSRYLKRKGIPLRSGHSRRVQNPGGDSGRPPEIRGFCVKEWGKDLQDSGTRHRRGGKETPGHLPKRGLTRPFPPWGQPGPRRSSTVTSGRHRKRISGAVPPSSPRPRLV